MESKTMLSESCKAALRTAESLDAVEAYIVAVFQDGDFMNDWLTHIPACGQGVLQIAGQFLAMAIGY
jgi:hypothetical protein